MKYCILIETTCTTVRHSIYLVDGIFVNDDGISIEYHWQQKIGWQLVKQTTQELLDVKRYPDVMIRKNEKTL